MLYRRESSFRATQIGDADELMQELFNATFVLKNLDQNNFKDASILADRAIPSSQAVDVTRSLTVGQKNGTLLSAVLTGLDVSSDPSNWVTSSNALSIQTVGNLRVKLYTYGQHLSVAGDVSRLDVRLLIDGSPGGAMFTHNMFRPSGSARIGWSLSENVLLGPGRHDIRVQTRDSSDTVGLVKDTYNGTSHQATIMAIGYRL